MIINSGKKNCHEYAWYMHFTHKSGIEMSHSKIRKAMNGTWYCIALIFGENIYLNLQADDRRYIDEIFFTRNIGENLNFMSLWSCKFTWK